MRNFLFLPILPFGQNGKKEKNYFLSLSPPIFPASVEYLIAPTKKSARCQSMHDNNCQQRAWARVEEIHKAKDQPCQSHTSNAAPAPFAQTVVEGIGRCTYQPAPAQPTCP